MWIDLDGSKFNTDHIAAVRPVADDDDQCVLFTVGQSALDQGFLVNLGIDEVFTAIQHARLVEIAGMLDSEPHSSDDEEEGELEPESSSDQ
jgi:hypothetical protein